MKIVRPVLAALSVSSQIRKQQVENCLTDCSSAVLAKLKHPSSQLINPSNAETNFVQTQECKDFCQPAKPYLVGIHWIALAEYSQMSTYLPGFLLIFRFFASLCNGQISHQQHGLRITLLWVLSPYISDEVSTSDAQELKTTKFRKPSWVRSKAVK